MDSWNALVDRAIARRGVVLPADVRASGVPDSTWRARRDAEGWDRPYRSVAVAPWAVGDPMTALAAALAGAGPGAAASGRTAAWLLGLDTQRVQFEVVIPARRRAPDLGRHIVVRSRWLEEADVHEVDGLACLRVPAVVLSRHGEPVARLRGFVVDAAHRGLATPAETRDRVLRVSSLPGRARLLEMLDELEGRASESVFHDVVLTDLQQRGYPVASQPYRVDTPDGRGVLCDIAVVPFRVAIEPDGDRWHRTRTQRRNDRRRMAQYAGTTWVPVPIDWEDWHGRRDWVLASIDAAILRQRQRGLGRADQLPPHLR